MNGLQGVEQLTRQMIQILQRMDQSAYQQAVDIYEGSSIGKHFRHILDFYNCLLKGLPLGKIDYSDRPRNLEIECAPLIAAHHFSNALHELNDLSLEAPINVLSDFSEDYQTERIFYASTIGRELAFIYDHAVHHLAIIKMGIKRVSPDFQLSSNFGIAPSTVKFTKDQCTNG
ncbi:MAG: hypothetical protein Sapg2KO_03630 [Saprospiraceae bacterium]